MRRTKDGQWLVELLLLPDANGSGGGVRCPSGTGDRRKGTNPDLLSPMARSTEGPRPAGYGDIAILLRAKTHLHSLEEALDRYGVPYRVHGGLGFFDRQEITDLDNLLAFLSCREDDLALYGVLRSPYFTIPDERLFHAANGGTGSLWERLSSRRAEADETLGRHEQARAMVPLCEPSPSCSC